MEKISVDKCFLEYLYLTYQVECRVYDRENILVLYIGKTDEEKNSFSPALVTKIREKCNGKKGPYIEVDQDMFVLGAFLDNNDKLLLFGPAAWSSPGIENMFDFKKEYGFSLRETEIPVRSYEQIVNMLALAYIQVKQEIVDDSMMLNNGCREHEETVTDQAVSEYQYERSFMDRERSGQLAEADMCRAVAMGDVEYFQNRMRRAVGSLSEVGDMAKNNRKKMEYMFVTVLSQIRMTVINAGMSFQEACDLSDLYLQKLEKCRNNGEILELLQNMRIDYTSRMRQERQKKRKNKYVEFCKDYIGQHITKNVSVQDLAERLGVSPEYLSKVFSGQEGETLSEYRIRMKLRAAKNQLKYSQYSIAEISEYFSFSSPSRFSSYFKKEFGMTPFQYRSENQVIGVYNKV